MLTSILTYSKDYIQRLWDKTSQPFVFLSYYERMIFLLLCGLEYIYRVIFFLVCWYKKITRSNRLHVPVISVGNIATGGTGKSVAVKFLTQILKDNNVAIISRGYARLLSDTIIVCDGKKILATVDQAGDEAYMLAQETCASIVVGNSRFFSWQVLKKYNQDANTRTKVVVLDDGYQNFDLVKNLEIVLVDAFLPFGNGHCLPAGPLREGSLSRAHIVMITRADLVDSRALKVTYQKLANQAPRALLCATAHQVESLFDGKSGALIKPAYKQKIIIVSAIANNAAFLHTVVSLGFEVLEAIALHDHHRYTEYDAAIIISILRKYAVSAFITTAKDWYKLQTLVFPDGVQCIVVRVGIKFLYQYEYDSFKVRIQQVLQNN